MKPLKVKNFLQGSRMQPSNMRSPGPKSSCTGGAACVGHALPPPLFQWQTGVQSNSQSPLSLSSRDWLSCLFSASISNVLDLHGRNHYRIVTLKGEIRRNPVIACDLP